MHIVPNRDNYQGIFHCQTLQGISSVTNGNPVINVRAGNSVKAHTSVLRYIARARLPKQKLLKVVLFWDFKFYCPDSNI